MTEPDPQQPRLEWLPELGEPVDLTPYLADEQPGFSGEVVDFVYLDEIRAIDAIPEGALTPVWNRSGKVIGHAEIIRNADGTSRLNIYGATSRPDHDPGILQLAVDHHIDDAGATEHARVHGVPDDARTTIDNRESGWAIITWEWEPR